MLSGIVYHINENKLCIDYTDYYFHINQFHFAASTLAASVVAAGVVVYEAGVVASSTFFYYFFS